MAKGQSNIRQVALLIESSRAYGRGLLQGIAAFARENGNWLVRHQEMSIEADPPSWLPKWKSHGHGVLIRADTPQMFSVIDELGLPTIDLCSWRASRGIPGFDTEAFSVVKLGIDHLRDRGYTKFGFCGFGGAHYSERRLAEMRGYLKSLGYDDVAVYESPAEPDATTFASEQSGMLDQEGLTKWLSSLQTPIGIIACNDIRAQQLLNICFDIRLHVPDQIAVIGVDNDDVIGPLCSPPLTSVEPNTRRIGYEAAAMLERMMNGEAVPAEIISIPAKRIVVRSSTDTIPVDDEEFVKAYRFIRENACRGVSVQDIADAVPMSRRALERRMRTYLSKSPAEVIAAIRLARIKQLLETTSQPLRQIAKVTGFTHDEHMGKFFKKFVGFPPGQYRKKYLLESKLGDD